MTFTKTSLSVLDVVTVDEKVPVLGNVLFRRDGTVVGANRKTVVVVGPVGAKASSVFPVQNVMPGDVVVPVATVEEVARTMTKDTKFGGLLEQFALKVEGDGRLEFHLADGPSQKVVHGVAFNRPYMAWRDVLRTAMEDNRAGSAKFSAYINLTRAAGLFQMVARACRDTTGESPVELTVGARTVTVRGCNLRTEQRILAVMNTYEVQQVPELMLPGAWERGLVQKVEKIRREDVKA